MKAAALLLAAVLAGCGGGSPTESAAPHVGPFVMIGDSITANWDDPSWTDKADLISAHIPAVIDVGVHGETCVQMDKRFDTDVLLLHPSIVYIECGTNDIGQNQSSDLSPLFAMIERAQSQGAKVIVGNLPPNAFWPYIIVHDDMPIFAYWREQILANASVYGYSVANYTPALELPDGELNPALFASDNTHPNSAGYAIMWAILSPLVPGEYK
jgi:lysophospholipase L1-like esterase